MVYLYSSNSTEKDATEVVILDSTPNEESPIVEAEPLIAKWDGRKGTRQEQKDLFRISIQGTYPTHQHFEPKIRPRGYLMEGFHRKHNLATYLKKLNP